MAPIDPNDLHRCLTDGLADVDPDELLEDLREETRKLVRKDESK